jgi:DNA-binding XRE family transcriptional regulator
VIIVYNTCYNRLFFNGGFMDDNWFLDKGEAIQALRKRKYPNDTQKTFAARIGVGLTTIQNLEAGKEGVAWGTVCKVLVILGCKRNLDELFVNNDVELTITDKVAKW